MTKGKTGLQVVFSSVLFLALSACGFQPMYQEGITSKKAEIALWKLDIAPIRDMGVSSGLATTSSGSIRDILEKSRLSQVMHNRLLMLTRSQSSSDGAQPAVRGHRLEITLQQRISGFGIRPDASASQEQVTLTAKVILKNLDGSDKQIILMDQSMTERLAYDLVQSDFASLTKREDSLKRLSLKLADRIHQRLVLFYRDQKD